MKHSRIKSAYQPCCNYAEATVATSGLPQINLLQWQFPCLAHHELGYDRKQLRGSASNAKAEMQKRSSHPSKAFVAKSRIHCRSDGERVLASSATLSLQQDFAVHQGTRKVSRKRFVAFSALGEF